MTYSKYLKEFCIRVFIQRGGVYQVDNAEEVIGAGTVGECVRVQSIMGARMKSNVHGHVIRNKG